MDTLERDLLWLGIEDYTGLWQAAAEARADAGPCSIHEAREQARRIIESQEPLNNETVEIVPPKRQSALLGEEASWTAPEEGGRSLRFATTDKGFAAYQEGDRLDGYITLPTPSSIPHTVGESGRSTRRPAR
jgi:hypothetical protein